MVCHESRSDVHWRVGLVQDGDTRVINKYFDFSPDLQLLNCGSVMKERRSIAS